MYWNSPHPRKRRNIDLCQMVVKIEKGKIKKEENVKEKEEETKGKGKIQIKRVK
jgi:hypothetical protein